MNPLAYLLVSLEFTSIMLAVIFLIAWLNFGRRPHALTWSLAFGVAAVQWILNFGSGVFFSDYNVYWLTVSLTSIVTLSLALIGHRQRAGLPNRVAWYVLSGLAVEGAIAYFTLVSPHEGLRVAIGPLYGALLLGLCVPVIIRYRPRTLPAEWGAALVTASFAMFQAAAGIASLSGGAGLDPDARQLYLAINFLSLPAAYTGMGLFTVLILASDMSETMRTLALTDPLTGMLNRRGFDDGASRAFSATRRARAPLSVIVADIDHFKSINDRYGHAAGDEALRQFAQCLRSEARMEDIAGRVGGEEFTLMLPGTPARTAADVAERLRAAAAKLSITADDTVFGMRASFGVAGFDPNDADISAVLQRADAALYQSKQDGRDRVTVVATKGEAAPPLPEVLPATTY